MKLKSIKLKRAGFLTKIVVAVLLVYMAITLLNLRGKIRDAEAELESYQTKIDTQQQLNAQLQSDVENGTAEDELESIARYKLGLVEPGEKVFYDITN
jgi:cell division protein FtsL